MSKTRLLLLTSPLEESQSASVLKELRKNPAGVQLVRVGRLPMQRRNLLTRRQTEVLAEIAVGASMKTVAQKLQISPKTAETHRSCIMKRLGIDHLPGLLRYALQTGIVPAIWLMRSD